MTGEPPIQISLDQDWASDEHLGLTLERIRAADLRCTLFVTNETPLVRSLRREAEAAGDDAAVELGIHPNFLPRPDGRTPTLAEIRDVVDEFLAFAPAAVSVRCHALVGGTPFSRVFHEAGLRIESNVYIPWADSAGIRPWRFWTGMTVAPFHWSDYIDALRGGCFDAACVLEPPAGGGPGGVRAVAFHPVHVGAGTRSIEDYAAISSRTARPVAGAGDHCDTPPGGVRDALDALLDACRRRGIPSIRMRDLIR